LARVFILNRVNPGSVGQHRPEVYGERALKK
jgi:hypothetical protein